MTGPAGQQHTFNEDFDWRPSAAFIALVLVMLLTKAGEIWTGLLPGNDDMMRLSQVRDLVAGQGWHDVDQSRFLTPEGGAMHWSRIPDLFMGAIIVALRPMIGQAQAEYVAVMAWPLSLLTITMSAMVLIMRRLGAGTIGAVAALLVFVLSKSVYQFWPGRIDHHGLQLTLTVVALAALLDPRAGRLGGAIAGFSIAAMLSVAMESLPYAAALIAAAGVLWVIRGESERRRLGTFGAALTAGGTAVFFADAPGAFGARAVCDAFGIFHYIALIVGGVGLFITARFGGNFSDWQGRLATGVSLGVLTVCAAISAQPQCLGSPYGAVPEAVMVSWMNAVGEARNIITMMAEDPAMLIGDLGFVLAGLAAAVYLLRTVSDQYRLAWAIVTVLMAFAGAVTAWQIRGSLFAHLFAALAVGAVAGQFLMTWWRERGPMPLVQFAAVAIFLAPPFWTEIGQAVTPPKAPTVTTEDGVRMADTCRSRESLTPLAALPAGNVFSPIDLGPAILVQTPHAIFAGPYHRNAQGILRVTEILQAPPAEAHERLARMDAGYFVYCPGLNETNRYAKLTPGGLADQLNQGQRPDWLIRMPDAASPDGALEVYQVGAWQLPSSAPTAPPVTPSLP